MSELPTPTNRAHLSWQGGHRFEASTEHASLQLESGAERHALSPMETMLAAIAGCMAVDVVDILAKMRRPAVTYRIECDAWRREEHPRRFTRVRLTHLLSGPDVDDESARRAVALSREKYCSAMASLHPDIEVENLVRIGS